MALMDRLVKMILIDNPSLVLRTTIHNKDVYFEDLAPGGLKVSASKLLEKGETVLEKLLDRVTVLKDRPSKIHLFAYHLKMLQLFQHLIHGRNQYALEVLMSDATRFGVDFSQLLAQAQATNLPYRLRAACCDVLRCLYIDRDPYTQVRHMPRIDHTHTQKPRPKHPGSPYAPHRTHTQ